MRSWYREHSLSIISIVVGVLIILLCIPLREGTAFDLISGVATAFLSTGLYNLLAGRLKEKNKPEDDPE